MDKQKAVAIGQECWKRLIVDTEGRFTSEEFIMQCAGLVLAAHDKAIDSALESLVIARDLASAKAAIASLRTSKQSVMQLPRRLR